MPITLSRKVDTDDDGSGTVGTIRNNAWLQDLQDRIDAALGSLSAEGTFTPALKFGGNSVGMTTSTAVGSYRKIGKLVYVTLRITLTAKGSSTGAATITGLPFAANGTYYTGLAVNFVFTLGASVATVMPYIGPGTQTITLTYIPAAGATGVTNMTEGTFANASDIIISGCYSTDS